VGGYAKRFNPVESLRVLKERLRDVTLSEETLIERRGGLIPVGGVLDRIANRNGLLIGDAAGAVSPLTAGGLDACMRLSQHAAFLLAAAVERQDRRLLDHYSGSEYRARFVSRLWMRRIMDVVVNRPLAELTVRALKNPALQWIAREVFFGRGSFPEVNYETRILSMLTVPPT
jgi:flavin-dependent dehydrogenase